LTDEEIDKRRKEMQKNLSINTVMSIPLLSINFYESIFLLIWNFLSITLLIFKTHKYPLPTYAVNIEGGIIGMFILTQVIRYFTVEKGVVDKDPKSIIFYIIMTVFIIPQYVFFLRLQTYVLLIEVVINWIGIAFSIMQIGFGIWVWKVFQRKKNIS
jgi:transmembrane protein 216